MQCTIPPQNMRVLVRAIHSLSRIGEDLYIEPTTCGLYLRTVNMSQSAYSSFIFYKPFFVNFNSNFNTKEGGKCKLPMKSCLAVFKSPNCMDKNVESCEISIDLECIKVCIRVKFTQGHTKHYLLPVSDNASVQLNYSKEKMCNRIDILPKTLSDSIKHFQAKHYDELTFSVERSKVLVSNHYNSEVDNQKVIRTNLTLQSCQFESYEIKLPGSVTFSLRELKAVCMFSDMYASSPIDIFFESAGKPMIFSISNCQHYAADYVISTLSADVINQGATLNRKNRSQFSDLSSTTASSPSGITTINGRKRKVEYDRSSVTTNVTRESDNSAEKRKSSLVDIIRYADDTPSPAPSPIVVNNEQTSKYDRVTSNSNDNDNTESCLPKTHSLQEKESTPILKVLQKEQTITFDAYQGEVPIPQISKCEKLATYDEIPAKASSQSTSEKRKELHCTNTNVREATELPLNAEDFFPDDINFESDVEMDVSMDEQKIIEKVFCYCFDYSVDSCPIPVGEEVHVPSDFE